MRIQMIDISPKSRGWLIPQFCDLRSTPLELGLVGV